VFFVVFLLSFFFWIKLMTMCKFEWKFILYSEFIKKPPTFVNLPDASPTISESVTTKTSLFTVSVSDTTGNISTSPSNYYFTSFVTSPAINIPNRYIMYVNCYCWVLFCTRFEFKLITQFWSEFPAHRPIVSLYLKSVAITGNLLVMKVTCCIICCS
jgi:hypothetical protein